MRTLDDAPVSLQRTLSVFRTGANDRTTHLGSHHLVRATFTPDGPGTLTLRWRTDPAPSTDAAGVDAAAYGPGADWLLTAVGSLLGTSDRPVAFDRAPVALQRALHAQRSFRFGASRGLYHETLPVILGQRITAGEAIKQWYRLVDALGQPAPGPTDVVGSLRLPPAPSALRQQPLWWFHPLGIEESRARPLIELARHPSKLFEWADLESAEAQRRLQLLPGIGPWTVGAVAGPALGDPDAVAVGDYHFPNTVAWFLAGEARADDDRMLELLEPYRGQRGRVLRAITATTRAPAFGPKRRILPMYRW